MKNIKNRVKAAEKKQEREPPLDIIGRYYDELTQAEKRRYWKYIYGDSFTLEKAEYLEKNYGLTVNTEDFQVIYKPYAENLAPDIRVVHKEDSK